MEDKLRKFKLRALLDNYFLYGCFSKSNRIFYNLSRLVKVETKDALTQKNCTSMTYFNFTDNLVTIGFMSSVLQRMFIHTFLFRFINNTQGYYKASCLTSEDSDIEKLPTLRGELKKESVFLIGYLDFILGSGYSKSPEHINNSDSFNIRIHKSSLNTDYLFDQKKEIKAKLKYASFKEDVNNKLNLTEFNEKEPFICLNIDLQLMFLHTISSNIDSNVFLVNIRSSELLEITTFEQREVFKKKI